MSTTLVTTAFAVTANANSIEEAAAIADKSMLIELAYEDSTLRPQETLHCRSCSC
jgi:hypothetical protein